MYADLTYDNLPAQPRSGHGYHTLMRHRVERILLVASPYDCFILEQDGRLTDQVFGEYIALNLTHHPSFNQVTSSTEALDALQRQEHDLVIITAHNRDMPPLDLAEAIKATHPDLPVVMLTYDRSAAQRFSEMGARTRLDGIYLWTGDPRLFLAMVKVVEDRLNVARDTRKASVRVLILVEDSPAFYSAYLPAIWTEVLNQTRSLMTQVLNDAHARHRARARPKILHARTFEEAVELVEEYGDYLLGLITDMSFPRGGRIDRRAGWRLIERTRTQIPGLPVIIQSADTEHKVEAYDSACAFADKGSPALLNSLRDFMLKRLGFGPFIFRMPDRSEVARAHDMQEMIKIMATVPDESLGYHAEGNHFSTWLMARTEFDIAHKISRWTIDDFDGLDGMRQALVNAFAEFELGQQKGVVTDFVRSANPLYRDFSRIGAGSMGGKARSIAFAAHTMVDHSIHERYPEIDIVVPRTTVLCSNIFDEFCTRYDLRHRAFAAPNDEEVVDLFMAHPLDDELMADLEAILTEVRYPLAVRSSSFSEDSAYQPLAGLFETVLLPNNAPSLAERVDQLSRAIRYVYASTFFLAPKTFMKSENVNVEAEQMGVVIQRLVGRPFGDRFYPNFAGVAQSRNFYPVGKLKPEDGLVTVALGLGASVADGQKALRFCPKKPKVNPQMSSPTYALRSSQTQFCALDMSVPGSWEPAKMPVGMFDLSVAESDGTLEPVGATYSAADDRVYDTIYQPGARIVNFAQVLKYGRFPLAELLAELMDMFEDGLGTDVEMEFAVSLDQAHERAELAVLQIRPLVSHYTSAPVDLEVPASSGPVVVEGPAIGHGIYHEISDIIFVHPDEFDAAKTREMAQAIGTLNARLGSESRPFLLAVPGRIGTEDPWLGIPVTWNQVSNAQVMVELSTPTHWVDPSQGTHFFHNITSLRVGYFNIDLNQSQHHFDREWLEGLALMDRLGSVCHARLDTPLEVRVDGHKSRGVIVASSIAQTLPPVALPSE